MATSDWLYLFSSNQSPLYEQDILDVLAGPTGGLHRFRYDTAYVEDLPIAEGGHQTASRWKDIEAGTTVVVIFSLQQAAQYFDPVFIPIRKAEVIKTYAVGSRLFVDFRLGKIVALPRPASSDAKDFAARVREFSRYLADRTKTPYRFSASLGQPIPSCIEPSPPWDVGEDQDVLFERTASYLVRTQSFRDAQFIRVLMLAETGVEEPIRPTSDGVFELHAGRTYDLALIHAQRVAPSRPLPYLVDVDGSALHPIGRPGFDIASRYDRVVLPISATQASGLEDRQTVLTIHPGEGVHGARVDIPVRVRADRKRTYSIGVGQALALILVALGGTLTVLSTGPRIALAVTGAVVAAGLQVLGTTPLRVPELATSLQASPTPSSAHHGQE